MNSFNSMNKNIVAPPHHINIQNINYMLQQVVRL